MLPPSPKSSVFVENAQRTAFYHSQLDERQSQLREISAELFAGTPACVLEIGCGHGHFLNKYAATYSEKFCLGLDIISDRIDRARRKQQRGRLNNLQFLHANAEEFLASAPAGLRFLDVYVLFPDPWPKRRHHKNRLLQPEFLSRLQPMMAPGSRLFFRTDDEEYYTSSATIVKQHPGWALNLETWPFECETVFQQRVETYFSFVAHPKIGV